MRCDSCAPVGVATVACARKRQPHADRALAAWVAPDGPAEDGGSIGAAIRAGALQRPQRGAANSVNVTIADTGLPGSPKTSCSPRDPNQVGLPGCSATPQKCWSTPTVESAGRTWSCGPTETPPVMISRSARSSASAERGLRRAEVVGESEHRFDDRAAASGERGQHRPVGVVDLTRAERLARCAQLIAGAQHHDARCPGDRDACRRRQPRRRRAHAARSPFRPAGPASRRACPRRRRGCSARRRPQRACRSRPSWTVTSSWRMTVPACDGTAAPVEIRIASPRRDRSGVGRAGARFTDDAQAIAPPSRRGPRSRPSRSCRTAGRRPAANRSSARTRSK